ncbi:MAG: hypothetical protein Tsb002_29510 [Wenzhouxiangellaceae bacterium]
MLFGQIAAATELSDYTFPDTIDPQQHYVFYLHGKLIEDQGIPAVSERFGEYQYLDILEALSQHGFRVISEPRPKDTNGDSYALQISQQINHLLAQGVAADSIGVIGASKGAYITARIAHLIDQQALRYVLIAICHPRVIEHIREQQAPLRGHVLSIYDHTDTEYAGSCAELFEYSAAYGLQDHDEIVLQIGSGHGILYRPLDEWLQPATAWLKGSYQSKVTD